jgi:hypothetical protein
MSTEERKMNLNGYHNFNKKLATNQDLIGTLEKALNQLKIYWLGGNTFKVERLKFESMKKDKKGKPQFRFRDQRTEAMIKDCLENVHKSLTNHARLVYHFQNYSSYNTGGLINWWKPEFRTFSSRSAKHQWQMVYQGF